MGCVGGRAALTVRNGETSGWAVPTVALSSTAPATSWRNKRARSVVPRLALGRAEARPTPVQLALPSSRSCTCPHQHHCHRRPAQIVHLGRWGCPEPAITCPPTSDRPKQCAPAGHNGTSAHRRDGRKVLSVPAPAVSGTPPATGRTYPRAHTPPRRRGKLAAVTLEACGKLPQRPNLAPLRGPTIRRSAAIRPTGTSGPEFRSCPPSRSARAAPRPPCPLRGLPELRSGTSPPAPDFAEFLYYYK